jgi:low affinity Fe/Cu permease
MIEEAINNIGSEGSVIIPPIANQANKTKLEEGIVKDPDADNNLIGSSERSQEEIEKKKKSKKKSGASDDNSDITDEH